MDKWAYTPTITSFTLYTWNWIQGHLYIMKSLNHWATSSVPTLKNCWVLQLSCTLPVHERKEQSTITTQLPILFRKLDLQTENHKYQYKTGTSSHTQKKTVHTRATKVLGATGLKTKGTHGKVFRGWAWKSFDVIGSSESFLSRDMMIKLVS